MKKLLTIESQKRSKRPGILKNGKNLVLVTNNEESQRYIVMEMVEEQNSTKREGNNFQHTRKILVRKKNLSVLTGTHMLRLYGKAAIGDK